MFSFTKTHKLKFVGVLILTLISPFALMCTVYFIDFFVDN